MTDEKGDEIAARLHWYQSHCLFSNIAKNNCLYIIYNGIVFMIEFIIYLLLLNIKSLSTQENTRLF